MRVAALASVCSRSRFSPAVAISVCAPPASPPVFQHMHVIIPQLLTGSEPRLYAISDRVSIWMQMRITFQVLDHHAGSIMQQTTGGSSNFRDFFGGANMAFADRVGIFNRSPGMTVGYDGVCLGLELVRVIFLLHCRWIACSSFFFIWRSDQCRAYFVWGLKMSDWTEQKLVAGKKTTESGRRKFSLALRSTLEKGNVTGACVCVCEFLLPWCRAF